MSALVPTEPSPSACAVCGGPLTVHFLPQHPWNLRCPHGSWRRECSRRGCTREAVPAPARVGCTCATARAVRDPGCVQHGLAARRDAEGCR